MSEKYEPLELTQTDNSYVNFLKSLSELQATELWSIVDNYEKHGGQLSWKDANKALKKLGAPKSVREVLL